MSDFLLPEYHMVVMGLMPQPSLMRWEEVRPYVRNVDAMVAEGARRIWETRKFSRKNPKPRGWMSAWDYIEKNIVIKYPEDMSYRSREPFANVLWSRMMSLTLDTAKMDPRYWGVDDPTLEAYCSYCKGPRPIEEFGESHFTCDPCYAKRKGGS